MNIGPDNVEVLGDGIRILATHEMRDWTLREFCRRPIYFRGRKYYLFRKEPAQSPYVMEYVIAPWPENDPQESSDVIRYDELYVAEREAAFRTARRRDGLYYVLLCFYPLLGLFWSKSKQRMFVPLGFEVREATSYSVMLEFCLAMLQAILMFYLGSGFLNLCFGRRLFGFPVFWLDLLIFLVLPIDCVARYGRLLAGDEKDIGFLEWVFRRK